MALPKESFKPVIPSEIRVNYRRTWQVRPYESESCELSVTTAGQANDASALYRQLAEMADQLMAERLEKHKAEGF